MSDALFFVAAIALYRSYASARAAAPRPPPQPRVVTAPPTNSMNSVPVDAENRSMHLGVRPGDVAPRILSVGDEARASRIAALLEPPSGESVVRVTRSSRGFVTHTGTFRKIPISIVVTGMGTPMMDFVVRECRSVVDGPLAIIRLGTCGAIDPAIPAGSVVVVSQSVFVRRCADSCAASSAPPSQPSITLREGTASFGATTTFPFSVSGVVRSNAPLTAALAAAIGPRTLHVLDATADSFYATQGRDTQLFDRNETLIPALSEAGVGVLQMETFHLMDLACVLTFARCHEDAFFSVTDPYYLPTPSRAHEREPTQTLFEHRT